MAGLVPWRDRDALTRVLGVQLQSAGLQARLTVREAVALFAAFHDDPLEVDPLVDRLGLGPSAATRYDALSGGQKQRLAIALALVGRPRVVLLDDHATGLDPEARRGTWELVEDMPHLRHHGRPRDAPDGGGRAALRPGRPGRGRPRGRRGHARRRGPRQRRPDRDDVPHQGAAQHPPLSRRSRASARSACAGPQVEVQADDDGVTGVLAHLHAAGTVRRRLRVVDSTLDDAYLDVVRRLAGEASDPERTEVVA